MAGWRTHDGMAVALPMANVDTDQLIPARFMSVPRADGYGDYLLHDVRCDAAGAPDAGFVLNRHPDASVLVAGPNFGTGSSREAAVYALVDAGFRAVFASGFGDIFASNAVNNGLLPARIDEVTYRRIVAALSDAPCAVAIDLDTRRATFGTTQAAFSLEDTWQTKLINGWDDIDLTQHYAARIAAFQTDYVQTSPWAVPKDAE